MRASRVALLRTTHKSRMSNGTCASPSSSKETAKSLKAANPSRPPSSTSTACPCFRLRRRKGVLRNSSKTSKGPQSSGASPLHLTHSVSHVRSVVCPWRGAKSEVAHKWANWLPHPCCIGEPHRCGAGGKIRSGPPVGKLATSPLPYRGAPMLRSGGQNQKWCPEEGRGGRLGPRSARAKRPLGAVLKGCP